MTAGRSDVACSSTTGSNKAHTLASLEGPELLDDQHSDEDQVTDEAGAEATDDENLWAGDAASDDVSDNEAQVEGGGFEDDVEEESGGGGPAKFSQKSDEGYESDVEMVTDATQS